jgi:hypothetical protein
VSNKFDFSNQRIHISRHGVFLTCVGVEVTIGATVHAEWDVEINGIIHSRPHPRPSPERRGEEEWFDEIRKKARKRKGQTDLKIVQAKVVAEERHAASPTPKTSSSMNSMRR